MRSFLTSRRIKANSGFTMPELMIVLAIMTVTLAVAIPAYHINIKPTVRLDGAARQLYADFQLARLRATTENVRYGLAFMKTVDGKYYDYILFRDTPPNDNSQYDDGEFVQGTVFTDRYPNVVFDSAAGTSGDGVDFFGENNSMSMKPSGLATKNGTVYLKNEKNEGRRVVVNLMGGVRFYEY